MAIARRAADLAFALRRSGVLVTLGGASTYGLVRLASAEEAAQEGAPALQAQLAVIIIQSGTLPGLAGAIVLRAGGNPYRVHRHYSEGDGLQTRIFAYPTAATAPDFWVRGAVMLPWAERTVGAAASEPFDLDALALGAAVALEAEAAAAGTDPALNVAVHHADSVGGPYQPSGIAFAEITDDASLQVLRLDRSTIKQFVKLIPTVTGTDDPAFACGAGLVDLELPR